MRHCDDNLNVLNSVVLSDEVTFDLNGTVNRHSNCRYWARQQPHRVKAAHTQRPQKINVWVGIINGRFIGPYLLHVNLTADRYLDHLRTALLLDIIATFPAPDNPQI